MAPQELKPCLVTNTKGVWFDNVELLREALNLIYPRSTDYPNFYEEFTYSCRSCCYCHLGSVGTQMVAERGPLHCINNCTDEWTAAHVTILEVCAEPVFDGNEQAL